jgi:hypothetical protein
VFDNLCPGVQMPSCFHGGLVETSDVDVVLCQTHRYVASGPLVRSSYRAGEFFVEAMIKEDNALVQTAALA